MEGYRFSHRLRVRYSEIDGQKIVFNAHYMTYLDCAVSDYFQEGLQFDMGELAEEGKFDIVLAKSTLEFKKPARLNDWLTIWCRMSEIGRTSMKMQFVITREGENDPLVTAEIIYVSYDPVNEKPTPVPEFVRQHIEDFEETKPVFH